MRAKVWYIIAKNQGEVYFMKKRDLAIVAALLSAVSTLCIKGMKAVGRRLERKDTTFDDITIDPEVSCDESV